MLYLSSSNKSKRKQVDNSEEALNERKKKGLSPPENGVQDVNNTERNNKAKKKKKSTKDRKNPVKEPKMAKQVHKKTQTKFIYTYGNKKQQCIITGTRGEKIHKDTGINRCC